MNKDELQTKINAIECEITSYKIDTEDYAEQYEGYLDNAYEGVKIGKVKYHPSYILRNSDNIAYSCGLQEYVDSIELIDDPGYQDLILVRDNLKDELETLES